MQKWSLGRISAHPGKILRQERGFALILALAMLALLSILGAMVLTTSRTEVGISGNFRTAQQAFFAADRAVEYAMGNAAVVSSVADVNLNDDPHAGNLAFGGTRLDPDATNFVRNLGPDELPDKLADRFGREKFGGNYYVISVTGNGPNGRSTTRIEAQQVRIFQKDDEGMLITTSGG